MAIQSTYCEFWLPHLQKSGKHPKRARQHYALLLTILRSLRKYRHGTKQPNQWTYKKRISRQERITFSFSNKKYPWRYLSERHNKYRRFPKSRNRQYQFCSDLFRQWSQRDTSQQHLHAQNGLRISYFSSNRKEWVRTRIAKEIQFKWLHPSQPCLW